MSAIRRASDLGTRGTVVIADGSVTSADLASQAFSFPSNITVSGTTTLNDAVSIVSTSTTGLRLGGSGTQARMWSSAGDNFNIRTHTNTPNPNFSLGVGNGSGTDSAVPIVWENGTLSLRGSGTTNTGIRINSSQYVRMGWQPTFVVSGGVGTQGPGMYKVVFPTVHYNDGNGYNASTGRFTCPSGAEGWYFLSCQARLDSAAGSYIRGGIGKNGTTFWEAPNLHSINGNYHSTNYHSVTVSGVMFLLAGDYVEYWTGSIDATSYVQAESTFTGRYLG